VGISGSSPLSTFSLPGQNSEQNYGSAMSIFLGKNTRHIKAAAKKEF